MLNKTLLTIVTIILAIVALIEGAVIYYAFYLTAGTFDLPSYEFIDHNDHIAVTGSWISDNGIGTISFIPINTTTIECDRIRGTCTEARAFKVNMTGHIITQIFQYEIKDWTTEEVVAIGDYPVAQFEIRFDRSKKVVTLIEKERAQIKGARRLPAYAHIDDGRKATKKEKK